MKRSTKENKLNALLGITEEVADVLVRSSGSSIGVTEEEIQEFRELQGVSYFLQAPALFTHKNCPKCGEHFLVSRKYVKYCSYQCLKLSLREQGVEWSKGHDLEAVANDPQIYNGNEPIWIRQSVLQKLREIFDTSQNTDTSLTSSNITKETGSSPDTSSLSLETETEEQSPSSPVSTTISTGTKKDTEITFTPKKNGRRKSTVGKRKFSIQ